jgi:hypothetical protein
LPTFSSAPFTKLSLSTWTTWPVTTLATSASLYLISNQSDSIQTNLKLSRARSIIKLSLRWWSATIKL